jgi:CMP-N-acetylneuraminic acid synthetase
MKKIGVFIPGRLSSERLPNKLILPLGESNLWDMACQKLNKLPNKYNKYVLAYDKKLIDIAKKYNDLTIIKRDKKTAEAEGPLKYIFKDMKQIDDTHLMFLNPCLSFLTKDTILKCLENFEQSNYDYATSVKKLKNWLFKKNGDNLNKINYKRLTTKEIDPIYQAAHCFHIFKKDNFFNDGMMLKSNHDILEVPKEETIDVDTPEDYEFAKFKWNQKLEG